ncbi:MAG: putative addiction module antidote protein [Deltaproteobacteria bacterium]|nr:putative addiction module antidote protein [Deltaproteobacteria bacterium]
MTKKITSYQEDLIEALKDPREAAVYLNAAIEDGDKEVFLLALRNVALAHGGMSAIAKKAQINRESLYRMLSKKGNPELKSIFNLLHIVGLKINIEPEKSRRSKTVKGRAA